jgi:hypothetical protein
MTKLKFTGPKSIWKALEFFKYWILGNTVEKKLASPNREFYWGNYHYNEGSSLIPSISICPALTAEDTPNLKDDVLEKYSITGLESNEWRRPVESLTADDIFDLATYDIWEVVSEISMDIIDSQGKYFHILCAVHVILLECQMTNLASNVCFDFFSRHKNQIWK